MKRECKSIDDLINLYFQGDTTLEEEKYLKINNCEENINLSERMLFAYFEHNSSVPDDLEDLLFLGIQQREQAKKRLRGNRIAFWSTAAAALVLFFAVFSLQKTENRGLSLSEEEQFALLEQALGQVSYSLQSPEDDALIVVFQDDDIELIMQ